MTVGPIVTIYIMTSFLVFHSLSYYTFVSLLVLVLFLSVALNRIYHGFNALSHQSALPFTSNSRSRLTYPPLHLSFKHSPYHTHTCTHTHTHTHTSFITGLSLNPLSRKINKSPRSPAIPPLILLSSYPAAHS